MRFRETLRPDGIGARCPNGIGARCPNGIGARCPDGASIGLTGPRLEEAVDAVAMAATPRWVWRAVPLAGDGMSAGGVPLAGADLARHLAGCASVVFLALTLGRGVDDAIRAAGAADLELCLLMDGAASALIEQYALLAEDLLRRERALDECLTGRYSPGYGDFPLDAQGPLLRLLDAPRAIGLSCGAGGQLLPAKSITAVLGAADHPVRGLRPGCAGCSLAGRCSLEKR